MPGSFKAVFFDAGMTLLLPTVPIHLVYHREAAALGVELAEEPFFSHMAACWKSVTDAGRHDPNDDHASSDELERAVWWQFTEKVASPFLELRRQHAAWLGRLFAHFDTAAAWRVAQGATAMMAELRARGVRVGIVSNWHSSLHPILDHLGLRDCVDFVLVSADVGKRKPHPEIFRRALDAAGVEPHEALHVGDSVRDDIEGATRMGIRSVLVTGGASSSTMPPATDHIPEVGGLAPRLLFRPRAET